MAILLIVGLSLVVFFAAEHSLAFLLLLLIGNLALIIWLGKKIVATLLFPYGQPLVKFSYHQ